MTIFTALKAPFSPAQVSWRIGSTTADKKKGMALAYIDARDVMDRLDAVCGEDGWQCNYSPAPGNAIICNIGIKDGHGDWIWKADGAGATDVEGEKGMLSDAYKRSAVRWGIGRYLYDLDSPWVEIVPMGRSYRIADHEKARLERLLAGKIVNSPTEPAHTSFPGDRIQGAKVQNGAQEGPKPDGKPFHIPHQGVDPSLWVEEYLERAKEAKDDAEILAWEEANRFPLGLLKDKFPTLYQRAMKL